MGTLVTAIFVLGIVLDRVAAEAPSDLRRFALGTALDRTAVGDEFIERAVVTVRTVIVCFAIVWNATLNAKFSAAIGDELPVVSVDVDVVLGDQCVETLGAERRRREDDPTAAGAGFVRRVRIGLPAGSTPTACGYGIVAIGVVGESVDGLMVPIG